jgi:X-Pro dipeptidyl-peptidase
MKVGHIDPFDSRREEWVDTLHRWFDYWLQGVPNGIMDEPRATVETDPGVYEDAADWPLPGTEDVPVQLAGTVAGSAGALLLEPGAGAASLAFTGPSGSMSETTLMNNPEGSQAARLAFLSAPLTTDLRISGTPRIELDASLSTAQSNLSVVLVDYGTATRTPRVPGDGMQNTTTTTCWGEASDDDDACYVEMVRRSDTVQQWRVSRGALDSSNRDSLVEGDADPVVPGELEDFDWDLEPYDHTFPAGHRIGVLVTTRLSPNYILDGTPNVTVTVTVDTTTSRILLPVVGGLPAAAAAEGLGAPDPVDLAFDLGGHGAAIAPQSVAYGHAPTAPPAPVESGWVFRGWYADPAFTAAYDFDAALFADATAHARWEQLADAVATLEIVPSSTSVDQGDTITVVVNGFDGTGAPLGDVTAFATLESSVDSDVIAGDEITFVHASPHLITARLGVAEVSVSVWVEPAAVVVPAADPELGGTGFDLPLPVLAGAALLVLLGAALLATRLARRRRRS